jgi:hypothetical protein
VQKLKREVAGFEADRLVLVLEYHVVVRRPTLDRAGPAETHGRAGDVLQLDGYVFHDVSQPGALALLHPPHETAGLTVGTTVLLQSWQVE